MKSYIIAVLVAVTLQCPAQEAEVLIIGTAHYFKDKYLNEQNFKKIQEELVYYNPDIICIESIPIDDTLSLKEIHQSKFARADSLKQAILEWNTKDQPYGLLKKGAMYWSELDFWNAYFAWDSMGSDDSLGSFASFHRNLKNSEYGNIVFPVARKLNMNYLYSIDYRYEEEVFLKSQNKAFRELLFKFKWKPLGTFLKIQKQYKKAEQRGDLMAFVNDGDFQSSFSNLIDNLPQKLKKSADARFVKDYWIMRNRLMAQRIHQTAINSHARRVLVTVGSAHVTHIKRYLQELGHHVLTYADLAFVKS